MIITPTNFREWAIKCHEDTNHFYDDKLPYEYHLNLAVKIGEKFKHLLGNGVWGWVKDAIISHDTIEDVRQNYNSIIKAAIKFGHSNSDSKKIAEAVRAVTNYGRGRDRDERMPDYVYKEIRETEGAIFVKLVDRLANVKHGLISESTMRKKYLKEQPHFKEMLYIEEYKEMWNYLDKLLTIEI